MGFSIAVDDIGAGYSGLEKIAHLNPRYLKFDMQLVRDIDESNVKREMARALKTFADKMDSKIIAEGIEREGERQVCVDLGIDYGQGYLLARPAPLETFNLGAAVSVFRSRMRRAASSRAASVRLGAALGGRVVAPAAQALGQAAPSRRRPRLRRARSGSPRRSPGPS